MSRYLLSAFASLVVVVAALAGDPGAEPLPTKRPCCEPGYKIVEEVVYKEVCKKVCRIVPDVKKETHTVYDCRCEDYCLKRCPGCQCKNDCCEGCPHGRCGHPRTKNILMKKIITEETPTTKCVVEKVVELVPVKVCRKVPCGQSTSEPILAPPEPLRAPKESSGPVIYSPR